MLAHTLNALLFFRFSLLCCFSQLLCLSNYGTLPSATVFTRRFFCYCCFPAWCFQSDNGLWRLTNIWTDNVLTSLFPQTSFCALVVQSDQLLCTTCDGKNQAVFHSHSVVHALNHGMHWFFFNYARILHTPMKTIYPEWSAIARWPPWTWIWFHAGQAGYYSLCAKLRVLAHYTHRTAPGTSPVFPFTDYHLSQILALTPHDLRVVTSKVST